MIAAVRRLIELRLAPLWSRMQNMISRGELTALDSAPGLAVASVSIGADDQADGVELLNPVGVSSRPAAGAEVLVIAVGGNPANLVAIPFVRGQRITADADLAEGEVALYIGRAGQRVRLLAEGGVEVSAATPKGGSVVLTDGGDVIVTPGAGEVLLGGAGATKKLAFAADVEARLASIQAKFDAHVHPGVTVGAGSTGASVTPIGPLAPVGATLVKGI